MHRHTEKHANRYTHRNNMHTQTQRIKAHTDKHTLAHTETHTGMHKYAHTQKGHCGPSMCTVPALERGVCVGVGVSL